MEDFLVTFSADWWPVIAALALAVARVLNVVTRTWETQTGFKKAAGHITKYTDLLGMVFAVLKGIGGKKNA